MQHAALLLASGSFCQLALDAADSCLVAYSSRDIDHVHTITSVVFVLAVFLSSLFITHAGQGWCSFWDAAFSEIILPPACTGAKPDGTGCWHSTRLLAWCYSLTHAGQLFSLLPWTAGH